MNRFETYSRGYTYVITRRFLNRVTGEMRVRVQIFKGVLTTKSNMISDDFRDFPDMHSGDTAFGKQVTWARGFNLSA